MSCNWPLSTLGDFVSLFTGFPFKSKQFSDVEGTKLLRGDNVAQGTLRWENVKRWTNENLVDKHKNYLLRENDVILAMDRPWIEAGLKFSQIESRDLPCYLVQRVACLRANDPDDQDFLKFIIGSRAFTEYVKLVQTGTAVPHISGKQILAFEFRLPPKDVRISIGKTLSDIDKKASINTQTNQTLEQMAQAIFKSWFVDFDPVKAKMNGEQPEGMDAATASLFPDKLVESELGLIPEGWEIKPIKDLCSKVQNGGTPKRSESSYWDDGDIPWLTSGEVRQSIITSVENRITQLGLDKSSAKWVPELSTLVALYGATAGEVSLTSIPLTTNQAVCALMPKKEHQWYNYLQLKSRVAELAGKAVGSAQQNISKGLVESTEVLSVPESLLEAFNAQVENLFKLRICNLQESVELANLRDTLLPKLLSGEIELGQAQELAEVE
ncbi:restriction endonuclease subunit S [Vibrio sp. Vb1574]|uniref:restriction endonuclease subunit S n=1 Tax=Vibrio harveyi group TaxID=717610 RepID=UPI002553BB3F|nr:MULTISPECIES: restriction endonuclease subunit S [Vibrio]MDW1891169.1 restriction endonuclease subunit S [Vibrio sp. Vb1574]